MIRSAPDYNISQGADLYRLEKVKQSGVNVLSERISETLIIDFKIHFNFTVYNYVVVVHFP